MYASVRSLNPFVLTFSLSLHQHPYICILCSSRFISYNKDRTLSVCEDFRSFSVAFTESLITSTPLFMYSPSVLFHEKQKDLVVLTCFRGPQKKNLTDNPTDLVSSFIHLVLINHPIITHNRDSTDNK